MSKPLSVVIAVVCALKSGYRIASSFAARVEVSMTRHLLASFLILVTLTCAAASQVVGAPARVRVSESILQGLMIRKVAPDYPPLAKQAKIQGIVVLKVRISKSGDVGNIQLVSGHSMLAPAAIEAVKRWKYMPYLLNAEPVEVETTVNVIFSLGG